MFIKKRFLLYSALLLPLLYGQSVEQNTQQQHKSVAVQEASFSFKKKKDKTVVPICTSFSLYGDNAVVGKTIFVGMEYFLKNFRKVVTKYNHYLLSYSGNNPYVGRKGLESILKLKKKSPIFLGLYGTETFLQLESLIEKNEITLLFPTEGAALLREKLYKNIIYFRPSHEKELLALAHYSIERNRKKKIAVFYEASEWGESVLVSLKKVLKIFDIELLVAASYPQGTIEVSRAVEKISASSPNAVFCLANPRAAYSFVKNAINAGLHKCLFLGLSSLQSIQKLLKKSRGLDIIVSSVVPNPDTSTIPLVQEYKKSMKSLLLFRENSPFYLENYISGALFIDCLNKIEGELSIKKIISCLESLKSFDFKGFSIHFNESDRSLSSSIWINPGLGQEWIVTSTMESV